MNETPQTSYNPVTMTPKEFDDKYWFNPLQLITVVNPLPEPYPFMVEMRHYEIGAGDKMQFPGTIANVYLDQMSRIVAQNEEKLGYIGDPNLRKIYYDRLIVDVQELAPQASAVPAYLRNVPIANQQEKAPWDSAMGERASEIPRSQPIAPPIAPPTPEKPKEETKEFEYNNLKFKSVTDKDGSTEYFKNDIPIDAAAYAKAASML